MRDYIRSITRKRAREEPYESEQHRDDTRLMPVPEGRRDSGRTLFTSRKRLFTRVVALAEKHGKPVDLLIVPATNIFDAVAQTAWRLDSADVVAGLSSKMTAPEQARELGRAWERLPEKPRRQVAFRVVEPNGHEHLVHPGAPAPHLPEDDVNLGQARIQVLEYSEPPESTSPRRGPRGIEPAREGLAREKRCYADFYNLEHKDNDKSRARTRAYLQNNRTRNRHADR